MGQITSGIRSILSIPFVYSTFQRIMGAHGVRSDFTEKFIRPFNGCRVLDIGCGPADMLDYIQESEYWGFDISEEYIQQANNKYGLKGKFYCQELTDVDVINMPSFDIVLALGLLHHLDDEGAKNVLHLAHKALKPKGRLLTLDPCLEPCQNKIARYLVNMDRGQNVRDKQGYLTLAATIFESPRVEIYHKRGIPYTHCFMECVRT